MKKVENGDLTVSTDENAYLNSKHFPIAHRTSQRDSMIWYPKCIPHLFEVRHMLDTVTNKKPLRKSARNSKNISRSTKAVTEGAIKQAEDTEACYKLTTELVEACGQGNPKSTVLMSDRAEKS